MFLAPQIIAPTVKPRSAAPLVVAWTDTNTENAGTGGDSFRSFTGAAIGAASSSRRVLVVVFHNNLTSRTVASATIGGVAATVHKGSVDNGGSWDVFVISAVVPTGTTADIVMTMSGSLFSGMYFHVFTFDNNSKVNSSPTISALFNGGSVTSLSPSIVTEAGGFIVAAVKVDGDAGTFSAISGDETYTVGGANANTTKSWFVNSVSVNATNDATMAWSTAQQGDSVLVTWK